jgi:hypothetical protein
MLSNCIFATALVVSFANYKADKQWRRLQLTRLLFVNFGVLGFLFYLGKPYKEMIDEMSMKYFGPLNDSELEQLMDQYGFQSKQER